MEICCDSGLTPFAFLFLGKVSRKKPNEHFSCVYIVYYICSGTAVSELQ